MATPAPTRTSSVSTYQYAPSQVPSARGAPSQVPLPQLEEGPTCWSMAGARAHPGMKCQVLPLPVAAVHALTLSRPSEGQHGLEGASF